MRHTCYFVFEQFRLDLLDEWLWDRDRSIRLGSQGLAVLQRLIGQPGRLVTKDDLLAFAWPDTAVSEAVLTTAMREIREALGDPARAPRFIQTVHGRGYRFIATSPATDTLAPPLEVKARLLVGREPIGPSARVVRLRPARRTPHRVHRR